MSLNEMMKKSGTDVYKIAILIISLLALVTALTALWRNSSSREKINESERSDLSVNKTAGADLLKNIQQKDIKKEDNLDLSNKDPEVGGVVEKVSKHILLPDRKFTVATVKDAEALIKSNPILYRYAKNGQKMIMYDTGIIVYDEGLDKIVDVIQFYNVYEQKLTSGLNTTTKK